MAHRTELERLLAATLEPTRFKDYGPNGLQVEGRDQIRQLVCGVTASLALIDAAIEAGADAILVHHGLFWRGQDGRVTGWMKQRLALLQSLHDLAPRLRHLAQTRTMLARLSSGMGGSDNTLRQWAWQRAAGYREDVAALLTAMDAIALDQGSLAKHLREACGHLSTAGDDPFQFLRVTSPLEPAFRQLYNQTLAALAAQAERAEQQHGICPIKLLFVAREPATA